MAVRVSSTEMTEGLADTILDSCLITSKNRYSDDTHACYQEDGNNFYLPFDLLPKKKPREGRAIRFKGTLDASKDQPAIAQETEEHLRTGRSAFLALPTNTGKTVLAAYLITRFRPKKVAMLCYLTGTLSNQWKERLNTFTDAKVQIVEKDVLDPESDVYIMGVILASHLPREVLKDIGMVIVDEAHMCTAHTFTDTLLRFEPDYLLALSATPNRKDGLENLYIPFFGNRFVERQPTMQFDVVKVETGFQPTTVKRWTRNGMDMDWSKYFNSMAYDEDRNRGILDLIRSIHVELAEGDAILVLCDRQKQVTCIHQTLVKEGIGSDYLMGSKKGYEETDVLVAGVKKGGTGIDDARFVRTIFAHPPPNVAQNLGRMRRPGIVYDLVDEGDIANSLWKRREKYYLQRNAKISTMKLS